MLKVIEADRVRLMRSLAEFREIVPAGTTAEQPKLQQAWRDENSGEIEWRTIPRVVVSRAEFDAA